MGYEDSKLTATRSPSKKSVRADVETLTEAYAKLKYAEKTNAPIKVQQRLYDNFNRIRDKFRDKYPENDFSSVGFYAQLDQHADIWLASKPMKGPGVWW